MADSPDTPVYNFATVKAAPEYDPRKQEHFWVVHVIHRISEDEIIKVHDGENLGLNPASVVDIPAPQCMYCEMFWILVHSLPCLGSIDKQFPLWEERGGWTG